MAQRPSSIDEFATKVKELYASDPAKVRFVLKYKHHEGTMTLRATNDELWLIYKTDQAAEFRRLEALQLWLMAAMCGSDVEALTAESEAQAAAEAERRRSDETAGKNAKARRGRLFWPRRRAALSRWTAPFVTGLGSTCDRVAWRGAPSATRRVGGTFAGPSDGVAAHVI
ncbi:hypothetical protein JL722_7286 [Aureococcus anophagefferens]|nr:hypothetical protein JL722_7286 [Aureococcus anophagefferens]